MRNLILEIFQTLAATVISCVIMEWLHGLGMLSDLWIAKLMAELPYIVIFSVVL